VYSQSESEQLSEPVRFEVIDQDVEGLVIKTFKGASVSGVAVLEGVRNATGTTTLAGYQISAWVSDEHHGSMTINSDGSFRLAGLPAGRLTLRLPQMRNHLQIVRIERDGIAYPGGIEIRDQEQIRGLRVVVSQTNGKIRGVLKLPEGLELPATARLLVFVKRTDDPAGSVSVAVADARGHFHVEELVAGTYEFIVVIDGVPGDQRPRIARPTQTVVVTGDAIADVTITLQRPKTGP
jgi:hypothetical protein